MVPKVRRRQSAAQIVTTESARLSPQDLGLSLLRIFAGLSLAFAHGFGKFPPSERFVAGVAEMGFPVPVLFSWAAGLSEGLGGVMLALGFRTRLAACFILATMFVATFIKQAGDPYLERELSLLFGAVACCFLLAGSGRLGLDGWLAARGRRRSG
jgi:putative oxidoreductase